MDLRADLLRPEAYGEPRPARVELVETHISQVFLAGERVYKVKKPVDLGFVDFRRVEQRRSACHAEVALNARLAPEVYEGVVPVRRGDDGRASFAGDGPVVDWAVRMVRLADEQRADERLSRGRLSRVDVGAMAARIAAFHASARQDEGTARFGTPEAVEVNVQENFAQTRGRVDAYVGPDGAAEIASWQTSFLREHRDLFCARLEGGFVRDGHGDLRLEHVYLPAQGSPTIIDCIEFSDRFRFADVAADIAFLSMDLAAHRRVDLAEHLLARYARSANDFDLYAVVDFYESYRAYVRGKISALVAADVDAESAARRRSEQDARQYFLLALSADRRSLLRPSVVAVGGVIGSGKSTLAERVGIETSAPIVEADRTRKALLGVPETQPVREGAWHGAYDPAFTEKVYAEVLRRADVVLASGRPVVLDASFRSRAMRRAARDLAARHRVPFRFVECRVDAEVARARLAARVRGPSVSDGRPEIFEAFRAGFEPVEELSEDEHLVLDTGRPLEESVNVLRERLGGWPPGLTG